MAKEAQRFEAVSWTDLLTALDQIAGEEPMRQAGLQFAEVTDLVQGQLFIHTPMLALQMARVVEIRFTALGAVAYLRTGIPVGRDQAELEAGAFLLALLRRSPATGEWAYLRYPRVKRVPNWRANLRRRIAEILNDLECERVDARELPAAAGLPDLLRPEGDDLENDLIRTPRPEPTLTEQLWSPKPPEGEARDRWTSGGEVTAAGLQWTRLQPAGISVPVWMSGILSLALILAALLAR